MYAATVTVSGSGLTVTATSWSVGSAFPTDGPGMENHPHWRCAISCVLRYQRQRSHPLLSGKQWGWANFYGGLDTNGRRRASRVDSDRMDWHYSDSGGKCRDCHLDFLHRPATKGGHDRHLLRLLQQRKQCHLHPDRREHRRPYHDLHQRRRQPAGRKQRLRGRHYRSHRRYFDRNV